MEPSDSRGERHVLNLRYEFQSSCTGGGKKSASTGRRVVREDGLEALEYIEEEDSPEIKVAKRLQGATESPRIRVFQDGKEVSEGYDYDGK